MYNNNNEQLIKYSKLCMIISGSWKLPLSNSRFSTNIYFCYSFLIQGLYYIFISALFIKFVQLILMRVELDIVIWSSSYLIAGLAGWIQISMFQRNKIPEMFQDIINLEKEIWLSVDDDVKALYLKKCVFCQKLILAIAGNTAFGVISFFAVSLKNFIESDHTAIKEDDPLYFFMYPVWLPYKEPKHITSAIFINAVFAFEGIVIYSVCHIIFATLMVYAATHLELLHVKINKLNWNSADGEERGFYNLREIAIEHSSLEKFIKNLNAKTKNVVLVDYILNSINVASISLKVINAETQSQLFSAIAYLMILVLHVFISGWLANEIKVQSLTTADALYQTNWYNQNEKMRRIFHITLMRSQRPLTISKGPFGEMNTETALTTLRVAYSYITLMQNYK
uniref:Odorant receptor n=1 Tax=Eucryptorrhynchus brandti TaxID=436910 RepID=A0A8F4MYW2_EUCBR|nr:odorant receptor 11 [Eucryptorrhynchus brandti]